MFAFDTTQWALRIGSVGEAKGPWLVARLLFGPSVLARRSVWGMTAEEVAVVKAEMVRAIAKGLDIDEELVAMRVTFAIEPLPKNEASTAGI